MIPNRNLSISVALTIGVVGLSFVGVIDSIDDWLFDRFVARSSTVNSSAVLVIATDRDFEREEVIDLAEGLSREGVRLSAFVAQSNWAADASLAAELGKRKALLASGDLGSAPLRGGIWRTVPADRSGGKGASGASAISVIAGQLGLRFPQAGYYLDFKVRREALQRIDARRVLEGDMPRSLVEGKVVLVGRDEPSAALISTPVHQGSEALSPVLLQAVVIDALLRDGTVAIAPPSIQWGVALGLAGLLVVAVWRWKRASALWIAAGAAVIILAAAGTGLWSFQWWLPPGKAIVLLCAAAVVVAKSAASDQRKALRRALRNLAADAQERAEHDGFLTCASPWAQVEDALGQSFGFEPNFVLLVDAESGALAAPTENGGPASEQCFASSSMRREQEPFSTALQDGEAILEDGLAVLPIGTSGRLFGFWVFRPPEKSVPDQARDYAARLGAMFEHREAWRGRARPQQLDRDGAGGLRIRPVHDQLESSIELLDNARKVLAEALDRSTEAVLVYDPFGKAEHLSRRAVELLGSGGIEYSQAGPADLLVSLTGIDIDEIRRALRIVALNGEQASFRASADLVPGRQFFVLVRPMAVAEPAATAGGRPPLPGLILLIQDVTQTARAALLKDEFIERIYFQLNNDFEAILVASGLLDDPRVEPDERAELLTMINEKIEQATGLLKETSSHLQSEFSPVAVERYPVRFEPVFNAARASLAQDLETHQVTVESSISEYLQLVLAAPKALEDLLHAILMTLVHDAREETKLVVKAVQAEGDLTVSLNNEGFGMPQQRLEGYLEEGAGGHETLEKIGAGLLTVSAWGGELTVRSEVGAGMVFELKLVSVV